MIRKIFLIIIASLFINGCKDSTSPEAIDRTFCINGANWKLYQYKRFIGSEDLRENSYYTTEEKCKSYYNDYYDVNTCKEISHFCRK